MSIARVCYNMLDVTLISLHNIHKFMPSPETSKEILGGTLEVPAQSHPHTSEAISQATLNNTAKPEAIPASGTRTPEATALVSDISLDEIIIAPIRHAKRRRLDPIPNPRHTQEASHDHRQNRLSTPNKIGKTALALLVASAIPLAANMHLNEEIQTNNVDAVQTTLTQVVDDFFLKVRPEVDRNSSPMPPQICLVAVPGYASKNGDTIIQDAEPYLQNPESTYAFELNYGDDFSLERFTELLQGIADKYKCQSFGFIASSMGAAFANQAEQHMKHPLMIQLFMILDGPLTIDDIRYGDLLKYLEDMNIKVTIPPLVDLANKSRSCIGIAPPRVDTGCLDDAHGQVTNNLTPYVQKKQRTEMFRAGRPPYDTHVSVYTHDAKIIIAVPEDPEADHVIYAQQSQQDWQAYYAEYEKLYGIRLRIEIIPIEHMSHGNIFIVFENPRVRQELHNYQNPANMPFPATPH